MTLDEQIAILQAAKEGKKIKRKPNGGGCVISIADPSSHKFDFVTADYEIHREPMEVWVNFYEGNIDDNFIHRNQETAKTHLVTGGRTVKFREVLDE